MLTSRVARALTSGILLAAAAPALLGLPAAGATTVGAATSAPHAAAPGITRVLLISVDGLNPKAITRLGAARTPAFHRLMAEGAYTLNARTEYERTETLPNHTGMVTGRRIVKSQGGHGVWWNDDRLNPRTVQEAAGHRVASVFTMVRKAGGRSAVFISKQKLSLFNRSWNPAVNRQVINENNRALTRATRRDLVNKDHTFTFLHLSLPDVTGHAHGFMGPEYLDAVARTDARIGQVLTTIDNHAALRNHLAVIVTADHGGQGGSHYDPTKYANYRVPFFVYGPGVAVGSSLYALNPDYKNPKRGRPTYAATRQPVRNGMAGNLALDLLGLNAIKGSELDKAENLDVLAAG